jgi:hypothetical protein
MHRRGGVGRMARAHTRAHLPAGASCVLGMMALTRRSRGDPRTTQEMAVDPAPFRGVLPLPISG